MTITTLDGLVSASRQEIRFQKASVSTKGASLYQSLWKAAGIPAAGATPPTTVGEIPTKNTLGALSLVEATGEMRAGKLFAKLANDGVLIIYDRLFHCSGLVGNITSEQVIDSVALTRHTDGVGVECFLETYTATGASAANATINYTNQAGTSGQTAIITHQVSPVAGQMQYVEPIFGCRAVHSVTLSATTGTAGDFGITLAKRICEIPLEAGIPLTFGPFSLGLPIIQSGACLAAMILPSTTITGLLSGGSLVVLQG